MEDEPDHIDFLVKYKDWIAIKRMLIRDITTPQEIAYHLSGIRTSADSRTYRILGIKTDVLDAYVDTTTAPMKKNFESLGTAIIALRGAEAKKAVADACTKELEDVAWCYLVGRLANALNSPAAVDQLLLSKIYKELKPPKQAGRRKK
jgi:hypothetical protein